MTRRAPRPVPGRGAAIPRHHVEMLISTLPEVPGLVYEVRGFVVAHASFGSIGGGNPQKMIQSLIEQATSLGANGIVDVRTVLGGDTGHCVMTGTAVALMQPQPR
jgi:hypothetical protein